MKYVFIEKHQAEFSIKAIGGGGTVGVAASVRNNLKTRTSLRPVSILRG